jgi:hypothetical protein
MGKNRTIPRHVLEKLRITVEKRKKGKMDSKSLWITVIFLSSRLGPKNNNEAMSNF